ncbi:MAG: hypothetical protein KA436_07955 [Oligoflexales bacterium]|nr:hypothetical protein [Oligoflexales bacterium]
MPVVRKLPGAYGSAGVDPAEGNQSKVGPDLPANICQLTESRQVQTDEGMVKV